MEAEQDWSESELAELVYERLEKIDTAAVDEWVT